MSYYNRKKRDELFALIRDGDEISARDTLDELCDDASLHGLAARLEESAKIIGDASVNVTGTLQRLGESVEELKAGSGTGGWVGALNKETARAVVTVGELTEQMKSAAAASEWVKDLERVHVVLSGVQEVSRMFRGAVHSMQELREDARAAVKDARSTLRIAESLLAETIPVEKEPT